MHYIILLESLRKISKKCNKPFKPKITITVKIHQLTAMTKPHSLLLHNHLRPLRMLILRLLHLNNQLHLIMLKPLLLKRLSLLLKLLNCQLQNLLLNKVNHNLNPQHKKQHKKAAPMYKIFPNKPQNKQLNKPQNKLHLNLAQ